MNKAKLFNLLCHMIMIILGAILAGSNFSTSHYTAAILDLLVSILWCFMLYVNHIRKDKDNE